MNETTIPDPIHRVAKEATEFGLVRKEEKEVVRSRNEKIHPLLNSASARKRGALRRKPRQRTQVFMSASSTDRGLLTPENCGVVFIDHQPQMLFCVANIDRQALLNNVLMLAKAAKIFGVPVILTAIESRDFTGNITPQLRELFPDQSPIERTSMNAWDSKDFMAAVKSTGRRNFLLAALWSEACLAFPALQMLEEGYGIYVVEDASGGTSQTAHAAAIRRMEQAGAVSLTALQVLLEFQRDWARNEHYEEILAVVKEHCGTYSHAVEYAIGAPHANRKGSIG